MGREDPLVGAAAALQLQAGTVLLVQPDHFLTDKTFFRSKFGGRTIYVKSEDTVPCDEFGESADSNGQYSEGSVKPSRDAELDVHAATSLPAPFKRVRGEVENADSTKDADQFGRAPTPPHRQAVPLETKAAGSGDEARRAPATNIAGPGSKSPVRDTFIDDSDQPQLSNTSEPSNQKQTASGVTPPKPLTAVRPDAVYARTNVFASIGFPGLTPTGDLRRAGERARVRQKLARQSVPDVAATSLDRVVSDPRLRIREAAAWYFYFGTADDAAASAETMPAHDAALARWHVFLAELRDGKYNADSFSEACAATSNLLASEADWRPLFALADELADVRLGDKEVLAAAEAATQEWTSMALFAVAATGSPSDTRSAAEIKADKFKYGGDLEGELGGGVDAGIEAAVLKKAAGELYHVAAAHEAKTESLLRKMEEDGSTADELVAEAEELVRSSRPWWELVEVFDDDPDSGEEGRALDNVAGLLRSISVSLANNTEDYARSLQTLEYAQEISQSAALQLSLETDLKKVRYLDASSEFVEALKAQQPQKARDSFAVMETNATTREDHETVENLRHQVAQIPRTDRKYGDIGERHEVGGTSSSRGVPWGKIITAIIVGLIIIGIISAAINGEDESSSGGASSALSLSDPAGDSSGPSSSGSDLQDAEGRAIDAERIRLERVEDELNDLDIELGALSRNLDETVSTYPNGAPQYVIDQYDSDLLRYNRLVNEYNDLLDDFDRDIAAFNRRLEAYNSR